MKTVVIDLNSGDVYTTPENVPVPGDDARLYKGPDVHDLVHLAKTTVDGLEAKDARKAKLDGLIDLLRATSGVEWEQRATEILAFVEGDRPNLYIGDPVRAKRGARYRNRASGQTELHPKFLAEPDAEGTLTSLSDGYGNAIIEFRGLHYTVLPEYLEKVDPS